MKSNGSRVLLFETKQAMESLRASGHDLFTAMAEPIDNSIQAGAKHIRIKLNVQKDKIDSIVIADDGIGMDKNTIPMSVGLGYSTRPNDRNGIGRFGVGGILGAISQARKVEYYSRTDKKSRYSYCCLNIDELKPEQREIDEPVEKELPKELSEFSSNSGTIAVWAILDKVTIEGKRLKSVKDLQMITSQLMHFLGRTYRKFIDGGINIYVNGVEVSAYDPLFLMTTSRFPEDPKAEILVNEDFEWVIGDDPKKKSKVHVKMTLLPEVWRRERFKGDKNKNPAVKERKIHENEGLSILRADREIFFGILPKFYPKGVQEIDRWFGLEISFSPDLDEHFAVRNVKKGAEPIEELREKLRNACERAIKIARNRVKTTFDKTQVEENTAKGVHHEAEDVAAKVNKTAPKSEIAKNASPEEQEEKLKKAAETVKKSTGSQEPVETHKERIRQRPFSLIDATWPTKDFITTEHISDKNSVLYLNNSHPFFRLIYQKIRTLLDKNSDSDGDDSSEVTISKDDLTLILNAIDLLLLSYMKAESMSDSEAYQKAYADLKHHWGFFLFNALEELKLEHETR